MSSQWTIQEVAKLAKTTSRTLRHYDQIGLLKPSAIGENGYRLYNASALIRLQRILTLRDLGMGLVQIGDVLRRDLSEVEALIVLERQLVQESARLERQIASVQRTLAALQRGESPMSEDMFDGFEHEQFKDEVVDRWGADAWTNSNAWWSSMSKDDQQAYQQKIVDLTNAWQQAYQDGASAESDTAQELAKRQVEWLRATPGPHTWGECTLPEYVRNLGEMYVNDPRFAANYGGEQGATLVRDALNFYIEKHV